MLLCCSSDNTISRIPLTQDGEAAGTGSESRTQAKREKHKKNSRLGPGNRGQNLVLAGVYVPHSLGSGPSNNFIARIPLTQDGEAAGTGSEACTRAKREQLKSFQGLSPASQGQNLAWTGVYLPYLLDSGPSDNSISSLPFAQDGEAAGTGLKPCTLNSRP